MAPAPAAARNLPVPARRHRSAGVLEPSCTSRKVCVSASRPPPARAARRTCTPAPAPAPPCPAPAPPRATRPHTLPRAARPGLRGASSGALCRCVCTESNRRRVLLACMCERGARLGKQHSPEAVPSNPAPAPAWEKKTTAPPQNGAPWLSRTRSGLAAGTNAACGRCSRSARLGFSGSVVSEAAGVACRASAASAAVSPAPGEPQTPAHIPTSPAEKRLGSDALAAPALPPHCPQHPVPLQLWLACSVARHTAVILLCKCLDQEPAPRAP